VTDAERRRRVEHVCDAALDRDPRERAAFVVAASGGDGALVRRWRRCWRTRRARTGFWRRRSERWRPASWGMSPKRRSWGGTSARTRSCRFWRKGRSWPTRTTCCNRQAVCRIATKPRARRNRGAKVEALVKPNGAEGRIIPLCSRRGEQPRPGKPRESLPRSRPSFVERLV